MASDVSLEENIENIRYERSKGDQAIARKDGHLRGEENGVKKKQRRDAGAAGVNRRESAGSSGTLLPSHLAHTWPLRRYPQPLRAIVTSRSRDGRRRHRAACISRQGAMDVASAKRRVSISKDGYDMGSRALNSRTRFARMPAGAAAHLERVCGRRQHHVLKIERRSAKEKRRNKQT